MNGRDTGRRRRRRDANGYGERRRLCQRSGHGGSAWESNYATRVQISIAVDALQHSRIVTPRARPVGVRSEPQKPAARGKTMAKDSRP